MYRNERFSTVFSAYAIDRLFTNVSPASRTVMDVEGKALLERAKEVSREVKSIWKMYMEYKVLSESGWTKLPGELLQAHNIIMEKAVQA